MGSIQYWSDYIKVCRSYIKTDKYIVNLNVNVLNAHKKSKYYFLNNKIELVKFIKYVILPSFVYNKLGIYNNSLIVQDYKDVLNFFMANDIKESNEIIKRYSFFYNYLEEFEYEKHLNWEKELIELIEKINEYFTKEIDIIANVIIYAGIDELLNELIKKENNNSEQILKCVLGAKDNIELERFLNKNKNNEVIMNFVIDTIMEIETK
ncbi:MAG: hypothetical protein ACRC57_09070 [Sarcina sp.]